jgi:hypothetical protein
MIRLLNASTTEVDEIDVALEEIFEQIDLAGLSKNSVGILSCYSDFLDTGVVSALCERLPFDVIGCTTLLSAADGKYDMYMLRLTILTSDDVSFSTAFTAPLSEENYKKSLEDAYGEGKSKLPGSPAFIISLFPLMPTLSGATVLEYFDDICGGIPIFGTIASDVTTDLQNCYVLRNGQSEKHALAMLLIHGDVSPRFLMTSLPDRNIRKQKAVVTDSDGCLVRKVNDMTLPEYLKSIGLLPEFTDKVNASNVPLMVDYGDGSRPVAMAIYHTAEDGSVISGGEMPVGVSFSVGAIDYEGIMETARSTMEQALAYDKADVLLMFPCITRYFMLAPNSEDEVKLVAESVGDKIPYALAYSGGEICPIYDESGKTHNHFHNYTFIACVF